MDSIYSKIFPVRWADADPNRYMAHSAWLDSETMRLVTPPQALFDLWLDE